MSSGSIAEQFAATISKEIGRRTRKKCLAVLHEAAIRILYEVDSTKEFHDVTGNLINSIAVGIYNKGNLEEIVDAETISRPSPTRPSLGRGEAYDLDYYYSGKPARRQLANGGRARPFVGKVGSGGQDGVSAARRSLRQRRPKGDYVLVIVSPMQYARHVENLKNHNVLSGIRDEIPSIITSIVTI